MTCRHREAEHEPFPGPLQAGFPPARVSGALAGASSRVCPGPLPLRPPVPARHLPPPGRDPGSPTTPPGTLHLRTGPRVPRQGRLPGPLKTGPAPPETLPSTPLKPSPPRNRSPGPSPGPVPPRPAPHARVLSPIRSPAPPTCTGPLAPSPFFLSPSAPGQNHDQDFARKTTTDGRPFRCQNSIIDREITGSVVKCFPENGGRRDGSRSGCGRSPSGHSGRGELRHERRCAVRKHHESEVPPIARRQSGVFTAAQAVASGLSRRQVRHRLAVGHWHRVVGRGLTAVAIGSKEWPPHMVAWAAHLTWPDAVIGRRLAGDLYGFPLTEFPGGRGPRPLGPAHHHAQPGDRGEGSVTPKNCGRVEVLVPTWRRPLRGLVGRVAPLPRQQVERAWGLPVTTRERTAVDLLATLPQDDAWSLLAWVRSRRILTRRVLSRYLLHRTGRRGTPQIRILHACMATGAANPAERRAHVILRKNHVTGWRAGARIMHRGALIAEADILFIKQRVIIEIDGFRAHSTRRTFIKDRRRQNELVNAGYTVLRFTWDDLTHAPDDVIRHVRQALAAPVLSGRSIPPR